MGTIYIVSYHTIFFVMLLYISKFWKTVLYFELLRLKLLSQERIKSFLKNRILALKGKNLGPKS
jgi:hypothetical protein